MSVVWLGFTSIWRETTGHSQVFSSAIQFAVAGTNIWLVAIRPALVVTDDRPWRRSVRRRVETITPRGWLPQNAITSSIQMITIYQYGKRFQHHEMHTIHQL